MKIRDRLFEGLLALAAVVTLTNVLVSGIQTAVFVDADGRPLGLESRITCPRCSHKASYILEYPVYECRTCGHRHHPNDPPCPDQSLAVANGTRFLTVSARNVLE